MNRLVFALFLLLLGCNQDHDHGHGHDAAHDHGHGHDQAAGHAHEAAHEPGAGHNHGAEHDTPPEAVSSATLSPAAFPIGAWTATLHPFGEDLRLTMVDSAGVTVVAEGEAKIVLSGTGLEEQRLTLPAVDGGWAGPARVTAAKGYTAVVNVTIAGTTESGKVSWGELPKVKASPAPHDHGGKSHDHGAKDHDHGDKGHHHRKAPRDGGG